MNMENFAVLDLEGILTKRLGQSLSYALGQAVANQIVESVVLVVDSPGGDPSAAWALADAIYEAGKVKPVYAYIDRLGCSAAYWVASQASQIWANPVAIIGSIGAFTVIQDSSVAFAQQGLKTHVLRSHPHKGETMPGEPVTEFQLEQAHHLVGGVTEIFMADVSRGRGVDDATVTTWADGSVYLASESLSAGLIDGIGSYDDFFSSIVGADERPQTQSMQTTERESPLIDRIKALLGMASPVPPPTATPPPFDGMVLAALSDAKIVPGQAESLRLLAVAAWEFDQQNEERQSNLVGTLEQFLAAGQPHVLTQSQLPDHAGLAHVPSDIKASFLTEAAAYLGQDPLAPQILADLKLQNS